jgi:hypothetical protein
VHVAVCVGLQSLLLVAMRHVPYSWQQFNIVLTLTLTRRCTRNIIAPALTYLWQPPVC